MKLEEILEIWSGYIFKDEEPENSDFFDAIYTKENKGDFEWNNNKTILKITNDQIIDHLDDASSSIQLKTVEDFNIVYKFIQNYLNIKEVYYDPISNEYFTGSEYKFDGLKKSELIEEPIEELIKNWYKQNIKELWTEEQKAYIFDDFGNTPDDPEFCDD